MEPQSRHENDIKVTDFGISAKPPAELNQIQRFIPSQSLGEKGKKKKRYSCNGFLGVDYVSG